MQIYFLGRSFDLNKTIITVGSVTYAIKARNMLSRGGVRSKLVKTDGTGQNRGCTHGLELNSEDFYRAVVILKENNINYNVYKSNDLP